MATEPHKPFELTLTVRPMGFTVPGGGVFIDQRFAVSVVCNHGGFPFKSSEVVEGTELEAKIGALAVAVLRNITTPRETPPPGGASFHFGSPPDEE